MKERTIKKFSFLTLDRRQMLEKDFFDWLKEDFETEDLTEYGIQIVGVCPYIDLPGLDKYAIFFTYLSRS